MCGCSGINRGVVFALWMVLGAHGATAFGQADATPDPGALPGAKSEWRGYERHDFVVDGCNTLVVTPKHPAPGHPWIWCAEFFDHRPETDLALLAKGFHVVYMNVGNTFGCPAAMAHWAGLYKLLTEQYGLSKKPAFEGLSRGGLYVYNWALANPDKVSCIYGDNPVCDFRSWPGGKGKGPGSPDDWKKLIQDYEFASEAQAMAYDKNPIDNLKPLADAKIPLIHVCGDADEVVAYDENTAILKERYEKLGGEIAVIIKKGFKHHPHGLDDPTPVVDFIVKHTPGVDAGAASLPRPTPEQVTWEDAELGILFCLDLITFTDLREPNWQKAGRLDPNLYNPTGLNTDQWMEAAKAMGARYTVFVAKWCTGHLQWQSDLYPYSVKQSAWKDGKGDVVKDYIESSRKYGIKPGIYASVSANAYWEVNNPGLVNWGKGGDDTKQAEYSRMCERMLTELWGNYGPLFEVWFDGGALPPDKGGPDLIPILEKLQPKALVFGGPATSIRWIGNEKGVAGYPCWATVGPDGAADGDPNGGVWQPAECDVPIRNHEWFWNPNEENKLYGLERLMEMYYKSVGRNCNMLVGMTPDRTGLVPEADFKRAAEFGAEVRRRFGASLAETCGRGDVVELALDKATRIDHVIIMEQISEGERVREYVVEGRARGAWKELCKGQSIGHKRIERFEPVKVSKVRLRCVRSVAEPIIRRLAAFYVAAGGHDGAS